MRISPSLIFLIISLSLLGCGTKSEKSYQSHEAIIEADSINTEKSQESKSEPSETQILKWKSVSSTEYGMGYEFEDKNGNVVYFHRFGIPGFSTDTNDFFTATPVEGTVFSEYKIKDEVKDKWFEVQIATRQEENPNDDTEPMIDVQVIVSIKPYTN